MKKISISLCLWSLSSLVFAHTADIDQNGCHADQDKHQYHCHYGVLGGKTFSSKDQMLQALKNGPGPSTPDRYYQGQVIAIIDGDHIKVRVNNTTTSLRLAEIDAPATGQEHGMKAKQFIGNLLFNKQVRILPMGRDANNTPLVRIYLGDRNINALMVEQGLAWADIKHLKDRNLVRLEAIARNQRRGLWASGHPTPPWQWRSSQHR